MRVTSMTQDHPSARPGLDASQGPFREVIEAYRRQRATPGLPGDLGDWPIEVRTDAVRALEGMIHALPEDQQVFEAGSLLLQGLLPETPQGPIAWTMGPVHFNVLKGPPDPTREPADSPANPNAPSVRLDIEADGTDQPWSQNPDVAQSQALQRLHERDLTPRQVMPAWTATVTDADLAAAAHAFQHATQPPRHPFFALMAVGACLVLDRAMGEINAETTELTLGLRDSREQVRLDMMRLAPRPSPTRRP